MFRDHQTATAEVYWYEHPNIPGRIVYEFVGHSRHGITLPAVPGLKQYLQSGHSISVPIVVDIRYDGPRAVHYYATSLAGYPLTSRWHRLTHAPTSSYTLPDHLGGNAGPHPPTGHALELLESENAQNR